MDGPIPVVCDRCRAEGQPGDDPFEAFGALLDFEPVPRRAKRADGWDAQTQRAFIAALSLTGSIRAACRAVGKAQYGVDQLLRSEGSEGFHDAMDKALAIASEERSRRLAEGLRTVAAEGAGWRPAAAPWANAATRSPSGAPAAPGGSSEGPAEDKRAKEVLDSILLAYWYKLQGERKARLAGKIVEADFYVRQLTMIEVMMDVLSVEGGLKLLSDFRHRGVHLVDVAATRASIVLDRVRAMHWEDCGEPKRPVHPPPELLVEQDGFSTEPSEYCAGPVTIRDVNAWHSEREAKHRAAAKEQIEWEAQAHAEAAAWRERLEAETEEAPQNPSPVSGEGGPQG